MSVFAVRLSGITKRFGAVIANEDVTLSVPAGSIHGVLGENGAGKSTLMKVLFGMIRPDEGTIEIDGTTVDLRSSADALAHGIGMVQQHFSLIGRFSVAENLILGRGRGGVFRRSLRRLDLAAARQRTRELSDRFGFGLDPDALCDDLSVGARQKVEIVKALWAGASTLVLDEPTAALSPPEAQELYRLLERLRADGTTVILISHKLPEVMRLCDGVTVLRDGRVEGSREISAHEREHPTPEFEADLVRLMIGRPRPVTPEREHLGMPAVLKVSGLQDGGTFGPVTFDVKGGEILAVVGVEGNGQGDLVDLLMGLRRPTAGSITLDGVEVGRLSTRRRFDAGFAHIPEDRHARAVADELDLIDNATIGFTSGAPFAGTPFWLSRSRRRRFTTAIIRERRVRAGGVDVPLTSLSGGNQQKLVVGRELARAPRLMIAAQPTRGLDIASTAAVHESLLRLRAEGAGVLLLSLDLAEVFEVADRIVVMRQGRLVGEVSIEDADPEQLGAWMSGARKQGEAA
ncbi:ABC transporter ATP-binding protein [Microbacterium sediminicola]|uniref:ABC transporter ATP-binding protein n=1 Tax=Microbacterium sediminicola TaxID=415210 RepID=A0ABN2IIA9_9MICO